MVRRSVTCALLVLLATAGTASARRCPNVMLVIDKSGSMLQDPSGGGQPPTKWDLVKTAVNQTVSRYAERVPLGLTTFGYLGAGACFADTTLEVDIKVNQGPVILQRLAVPPNPQASTNTGEGIRRAYTDSKFLADPARSNYLILITDGTPNCSKPEPDTTINFIKAAAAMNPSIHTFVVGFDAVVGGNGVDPGALNRMAVAGLEAQAGCDIDPAKKLPCYYSASDDATFIAAIDKIIGGVAGNTAIGACDDTCMSLGCPAGQACRIPTTGAPPVCQDDLCFSVSCDAGMYCKEGHCLRPCPICPEDEMCLQETCVKDPCPRSQQDLCAMSNRVCDSIQESRTKAGMEKLVPGPCADNICASNRRTCPLPTTCNPVTGECADDACRLVNCPALSTCSNGYCMTDPVAEEPDLAMVVAPDASIAPAVDLKETNAMEMPGDCNCALGGRGRTGAPLPLLLSLLAALVLRAARRRTS